MPALKLSFYSRTYSYLTLHGIWVILISQNLLKALANVKANVAESDAAIPTSKYTEKECTSINQFFNTTGGPRLLGHRLP